MKRYLIVIEEGAGNLSAYSPDLPGCVATGKSRSEVEQNMRESIKFHIDGLREEGLAVPEPSSSAEYLSV
ncbi:MAG: type II toxin-antitoxin system HicB family antitoxin [Acidobacteria bacterium]|nr:type II toxin-antitoxin system HicB family antitoxin [Acidobacteriota bacterium]